MRQFQFIFQNWNWRFIIKLKEWPNANSIMEELELIIAPYMAKMNQYSPMHQLEKPVMGFVWLSIDFGGKKKKKKKLHSFLIFLSFLFFSLFLFIDSPIFDPSYLLTLTYLPAKLVCLSLAPLLLDFLIFFFLLLLACFCFALVFCMLANCYYFCFLCLLFSYHLFTGGKKLGVFLLCKLPSPIVVMSTCYDHLERYALSFYCCWRE